MSAIDKIMSQASKDLHYNKIVLQQANNHHNSPKNDEKFHHLNSSQPDSIIHKIHEIYFGLEDTLFNYEKDILFEEKIIALSEDIISLMDLNKNLMIATILHCKFQKYTIKHSVDTAILSLLVASSLGKTPLELKDLVCACLTMNIGMLEEHDVFQYLSFLNDEQKNLVINHAKISYDILKNKGIINFNWLNHVLYHNGQIQNLSTINENTHIIMIADRYCALLAQRINRNPLTPSEAIHYILIHQKEGISPLLSYYFIKQLGMYQSGSLVKLLNGEVGVVIEKGSKKTNPIVLLIIDKDGKTLEKPYKQDTSNSEFKILNTIPLDSISFNIDMMNLWF